MNDRAAVIRPLQNIRAEEAVIGKIIASAGAYWEIEGRLTREHFTVGHHRAIFDAVEKCAQTSSGPSVTRLESMLPLEIEGVGATEAVLQILIEKAIDVGSPTDYIDDILAAWRERERVAIGKIATQSGKSFEDVRGAIEARLRAVDDIDAVKHAAHIGEAAEAALRKSAEAHQHVGKRVIGVQTGISIIDEMLGPLPGGTVVTIAAQSGHGKSGLLSQIMMNNAAPSLDPTSIKASHMFSMEMSREQNGYRNLASMTGISIRKQIKGDFTEKEFEDLQRCQRKLLDMPIYIQDRSGLNIEEIAAECRAAHRRYGVRIFGLDHLKLIRPMKDNWTMVQTIEHATSRIKSIAKENDGVFFQLAQITKEGQKSGGWRFTKADIYGGGMVVENSDVVLGVSVPSVWLRENRPEPGGENQPKEREIFAQWVRNTETWKGRAEVASLKMRDGPTSGWKEIDFNGERIQFGSTALDDVPF